MANMEIVKQHSKNMVLKPMEIDSKVLESVMLGGDLSKLTPDGRVMYYAKVCESLRLNPLTKPFDYIVLNGKLTLYARKDCTQQLCNLNHISTEVTKKEKIDDIYIVTVKATMSGRSSEDDGAVNVAGLKGDQLANALMKAVTKAKRRAVLGICGLGIMDETEIETIEGEVKHLDTPIDMGKAEVVAKETVKAPEQALNAVSSPENEETVSTLASLKDASVGSTVSEFTGVVKGFTVRKTKTGKEITEYKVEDEDGGEYKISKWGGAHKDVANAICTFYQVAVSEWRKDEQSEPIRQYKAEAIKTEAEINFGE